MNRSWRPPTAPPTPASVSRTISGGRPSAEQICRWSTCSHCVATYSSTPPSSAGTASPDSGPRKAWSCIPTSYSPTTTTSAMGSGSPFLSFRCRTRLPCGCSAAPSRDVVDLVPPRVAEGLAGVGDRLVDVIVDPDPLGRLAGDLRVVGGDERDRLAVGAHRVDGEHRLVDDLQPVELVARHVLVGEHRVHAGRGQRRADVDGADPGRRGAG